MENIILNLEPKLFEIDNTINIDKNDIMYIRHKQTKYIDHISGISSEVLVKRKLTEQMEIAMLSKIFRNFYCYYEYTDEMPEIYDYNNIIYVNTAKHYYNFNSYTEPNLNKENYKYSYDCKINNKPYYNLYIDAEKNHIIYTDTIKLNYNLTLEIEEHDTFQIYVLRLKYGYKIGDYKNYKIFTDENEPDYINWKRREKIKQLTT
jgi:hypothetical protein